jgi:transcriptional regulator with XRE-family HTH domain
MNFGNRLRELRGKVSREVVAEAIGVSVSSYAKYERNERVPRDAVKLRISEYYRKPVQAIFFDQGEHI